MSGLLIRQPYLFILCSFNNLIKLHKINMHDLGETSRTSIKLFYVSKYKPAGRSKTKNM